MTGGVGGKKRGDFASPLFRLNTNFCRKDTAFFGLVQLLISSPRLRRRREICLDGLVVLDHLAGEELQRAYCGGGFHLRGVGLELLPRAIDLETVEKLLKISGAWDVFQSTKKK